MSFVPPFEAQPTYYDETAFDPDIPNPLAGFRLSSRYDEGWMAYHIGCLEGTRLRTEGADENGVIEPDVLFLDFLMVGMPMRNRKLSTEVLKAALTEAKDRGFTTARGAVVNHRVISSLQRLAQEGVLTDLRFIPVDTEFAKDLPTAELFEREGAPPQVAKIWLEEQESGDRSYENATVDAVFRIAE